MSNSNLSINFFITIKINSVSGNSDHNSPLKTVKIENVYLSMVDCYFLTTIFMRHIFAISWI